MATDNSFDVVSDFDRQEMKNASIRLGERSPRAMTSVAQPPRLKRRRLNSSSAWTASSG